MHPLFWREEVLVQLVFLLGILFVGIGFMKDGFGPLKESPQIQRLFVMLGDKPLLAILAGAVVTMLLQSSSAAIAIVQGALPEKETLDKAAQEGIPILVSAEPEFETAGRIYQLLHSKAP